MFFFLTSRCECICCRDKMRPSPFLFKFRFSFVFAATSTILLSSSFFLLFLVASYISSIPLAMLRLHYYSLGEVYRIIKPGLDICRGYVGFSVYIHRALSYYNECTAGMRKNKISNSSFIVRILFFFYYF